MSGLRKHSVCGAAKAAKFNSYNRKQHVATLASGFAGRADAGRHYQPVPFSRFFVLEFFYALVDGPALKDDSVAV